MYKTILILMTMACTGLYSANKLNKPITSHVSALESKLDPQTRKMLEKTAEQTLERHIHKADKKLTALEARLQDCVTQLTVASSDQRKQFLQKKISKIEKKIQRKQDLLHKLQQSQASLAKK